MHTSLRNVETLMAKLGVVQMQHFGLIDKPA